MVGSILIISIYTRTYICTMDAWFTVIINYDIIGGIFENKVHLLSMYRMDSETQFLSQQTRITFLWRFDLIWSVKSS